MLNCNKIILYNNMFVEFNKLFKFIWCDVTLLLSNTTLDKLLLSVL